MSPLRLGLFGGTFDPPHLGHLAVAQAAADVLSLDGVLFLVAGSPPHKAGERLSPAPVRVEMTRAAVAGNSAFEVSDVELNREGPSYTVDTLRLFRARHPDADLFFLLGADQLAEFDDWQEPEAVVKLATLVAVTRDGVDPDRLMPSLLNGGGGGRIMTLPFIRLDLSSSEIRSMVKGGRSIRYLVPDEVIRIIETHCLYRSV